MRLAPAADNHVTPPPRQPPPQPTTKMITLLGQQIPGGFNSDQSAGYHVRRNE